MAATKNQTLWGFIFWIKHNRHISVEAMTEDDLDAYALAFTTVNATVSSLTTTDPLTYDTLEWPQDGGLADQAGITAVGTQATADQSHYPETHYSGG